jgi:dolichol-phosphate mannosyltransferase
VTLSRNFGHQEALTAGYDYAQGAAVITLDADCQHPPEMIPELVGKWREGYEVVYTVKARDPNVSRLRRLTVKCVYGLIARCTGMDVADQADFRLLDRKVVDVIRQLREHCRFLRGLSRWVGFRQVGVEYTPAPRAAGEASYTLAKLARMGSAGLFNFSIAPLRLIGVLGASLLAMAILYGVIALLAWPFVGASLTANLVFFAVGLVGLQLAMTGLLAEYLGRMYEQSLGRPIYIVREAVGFDERTEAVDEMVTTAKTESEDQSGRIRLFT